MTMTSIALGRETPFQIDSLAEGKLLITYSNGQSVYRHETNRVASESDLLKTVEAACVLPGEDSPIVVLSGDTVTIYDTQLQSTAEGRLGDQGAELNGVVPISDTRFLTTDEDSQVLVWTLVEGRLEVENSWSVECTPLFCKQDGKVTFCTERGRFQERDSKTGMVLKTWAKSSPIVWATTDKRELHLFTIDESGKVEVWDLASREPLFQLLFQVPALRVALHSSGLRGAVLGTEGEVDQFEIAEGGGTHSIATPTTPIVSITYEGDTLLGVDENGEIWNLSDEEPRSLGGLWAGWATCACSAGEGLLAVGTAHGTVELFDDRGERQGPGLSLHQDAVIALLPTSDSLLSVSADGIVKGTTGLGTNGANSEVIAEHPGTSVVDACLSSDRSRLWLALEDGVLAWQSLVGSQRGHYQLKGRRIEEIQPSGAESVIVLTDRGSVKLLRLA